jgi:uncharacterized protein YcbX
MFVHLSQARVRVGRVLTLARFPVKSTAGEALQTVEVDQRGLLGDRGWAVYTADGGIASGKTSRRFRQIDGLMKWRSTAPVDSNDVPQLHSPRGSSYSVDDPRAAEALTHNFGQPLTLRPERSMSHYDDCPIHLVTTSSIRQIESFIGSPVDHRRTRANIVLDTDESSWLEDSWEGLHLAIGPQLVLRIGSGMTRCVMVDQPQVGVLGGSPILKALGDVHEVILGVKATVAQTGSIAVHDDAYLLR